MTTHPERHLKTGGDPRTLADYAALRDEMNKLSHPARPDVNWQQAEKLSLLLFEHNGVELQTTAWYTLVRTHLAGLYGLNEGLAILEALVVRQWGKIWPHPVHVRVEILNALSKRLQQVMRTLTLTSADLSQLHEAEGHLNALIDVLQRLELKHSSQLGALCALMRNAAARLEKNAGMGGSDSTQPEGVIIPAEAYIAAGIPTDETIEQVKRVYVTQPEVKDSHASAKPWKPFVAGMMTMLMMAGTLILGWQAMHQPDPMQVKFAATLAPLPVTLSADQLQSLRPEALSPKMGIRQTQQQLARLLQLKPDWALSYGDSLVQQALKLWTEQGKALAQQWHQQMKATALPAINMNGWHEGMTQLQQLANRLNALDEQKGKYMTVSELKSAVFAITQSFSGTVPAEEQLRQLAAVPEGEPWPAAQQSQLELHLQQLISRYALLKQNKTE
ncbi:VasL domain-containing protein [Leclercia sp.]|uniref:VasL domain-containing protein n=1 Tax=Leclercia sp. TaxID=1898428 RepID=UPI002FDEA867